MKSTCLLLVILLLAPLALAKNKGKTVNMTCDQAVTKIEVLATDHNWSITDAVRWKGDANGEARTMHVQTEMAGVGKTVGVQAATLGIGGLFMVPKSGTLVLVPKGETCEVHGQGKPAEKLVKELLKE
ncbi:MAG TPA: hypothetical protein VNZ03_28105 [Terriglobales bacterium]|jgi:hypothetical protein|nr:hypothetical protein [Terriglobales bacterium]